MCTLSGWSCELPAVTAESCLRQLSTYSWNLCAVPTTLYVRNGAAIAYNDSRPIRSNRPQGPRLTESIPSIR